MIEPREPQYQWGQRVSACVDLFNDGGLPGHDAEALLVHAGDVGEIVQIGMHTETNTPIYLVEFGGVVIGCLEDEIERVEIEIDAAEAAVISEATAESSPQAPDSATEAGA